MGTDSCLGRFLVHTRYADLSENPLRDVFFQDLLLEQQKEFAVEELVVQSCMLTE